MGTIRLEKDPRWREVVGQICRVLRGCWRASSLVEGINSVARMHQSRHRRMTQGLLDLKRLYWNMRPFRTGRRRRCSTSHTAKNKGLYLLTGLLFCGHCKAKMYGARRTRRKGRRLYEGYKYICSTYHGQGKHVCGCNTIDQGLILDFLIRKLQEAAMAGGNKDELRKRLRERLEARQKVDPAEVAALETKVSSLTDQVQVGAKRLLRAPDDVADLLGSELSALRRERDRAAAALLELQRRTQPTDVESEVEAAVDRLWTLGEQLANAKPERLRELIRRMVSRIELHFDSVQKRTRTEHPFSHGRIELRPDPALCVLSSVSRGDWI